MRAGHNGEHGRPRCVCGKPHAGGSSPTARTSSRSCRIHGHDVWCWLCRADAMIIKTTCQCMLMYRSQIVFWSTKECEAKSEEKSRKDTWAWRTYRERADTHTQLESGAGIHRGPCIRYIRGAHRDERDERKDSRQGSRDTHRSPQKSALIHRSTYMSPRSPRTHAHAWAPVPRLPRARTKKPIHR